MIQKPIRSCFNQPLIGKHNEKHNLILPMHRTAAVETRGCHGLAGRGTFTLLLGSAMDTTLKYHYMAVPTAAHPESKLLALRCITRRSGCTHALKKYFTAGMCLAVLFRRTKMVFSCAVGREERCKQITQVCVGSACSVSATLGLPLLMACVHSP